MRGYLVLNTEATAQNLQHVSWHVTVEAVCPHSTPLPGLPINC